MTNVNNRASLSVSEHSVKVKQHTEWRTIFIQQPTVLELIKNMSDWSPEGHLSKLLQQKFYRPQAPLYPNQQWLKSHN